MKLKLYFLLAFLSVLPALGMEEQLNAKTILTHPKFLLAKQRFEGIGGVIEVWDHALLHCIQMNLPSYGLTNILFERVDFWEYMDWYYGECLKWKSSPEGLKVTLPKTLQGLCILTLSNEYKKENKEIIAGVDILPEKLKEQVLLMAGK